MVQHGTVYEQRPGYYEEPQNAVYGYEMARDSFYSQPPYQGPPHGYENPYGDIRFHQHVGADQNPFNRKRRGNLPKEATNLLKEWFAANRSSPYPTEEQKMQLCTRTGLSLNQVCFDLLTCDDTSATSATHLLLALSLSYHVP